jgi:hypothetical protein
LALNLDPVTFGPAQLGVAGGVFLAVPLTDSNWASYSSPTPEADDGAWANWFSIPNINVNTAYAGITYVTTAAFQAWVEGFGFPFVFRELFYPLELDWFELPSTLVQADGPTSVTTYDYTGEIGSFRGATGSSGELDTINALTATLDHEVDTPGAGLNFFARKMPVWRLEAAVPMWKKAISATAPIEVWNRVSDRSPGKLRVQYSFTVGGQVRFDPTPLAFMLWIAGYGIATETVRAVTGFTGGTPWMPADYTFTAPTTTYPPGGGAPVDSGVKFSREAGPHVFTEMETPAEDSEAMRRFELFVRWMQREEQWFGCQITASAGLAAKQHFYSIPQSQWGTAANWWRGSSTAWLSAALGPGTKQWEAYAAAGAAQHFEAGVGFTAIQAGDDEAMKVYFRPLSMAVAL